MPLSTEDIEALEKKYFLELKQVLSDKSEELVERFDSRLLIARDTEGISYKENEVDIGAERILMSIICRNKPFWTVNSSPVSSDLLFDLPDALLNIDAKTYKESGKEENKVNLRRNQTSYRDKVYCTSQRSGARYTWKAALKKIYCHNTHGDIPCLTYIVKFIYYNENQSVIEIQLINIPNGKLISTYGRDIFNRGKSSIVPGKPVSDKIGRAHV